MASSPVSNAADSHTSTSAHTHTHTREGADTATHVLTPDILVRLKRLGDISVAGDKVAYSTSHWDGSKRVQEVWLCEDTHTLTHTHTSSDTDTDTDTHLLSGAAHSGIALSSDGSTVFAIGGADSRELWALSTARGATLKVAELPVAIAHVRTHTHVCGGLMSGGEAAGAAPGGLSDVQVVTFSAAVRMRADGTACSLEETARLDAEDASRAGTTALAFDSLPVRHWDTWDAYAKTQHVFVMALVRQGDTWVPGTCIDVMTGFASDCPTKPFGGEDDFALSPDGKLLTFVARPIKERHQMMWSTAINVHTVPVPVDEAIASARNAAAAAARRRVTDVLCPPLSAAGSEPATSSADSSTNASATPRGSVHPSVIGGDRQTTHASPCFSPDGRYLAAVSMSRAGYEADALKLMVATVDGAKLWRPLEHVDAGLTDVKWAPVIAPVQDASIYVLYGTTDIGARSRVAIVLLRFPSDTSGAAVEPSAQLRIVDVPHSCSRATCRHASAADGMITLGFVAAQQSMRHPAELVTLSVSIPTNATGSVLDGTVGDRLPFNDARWAELAVDTEKHRAASMPIVGVNGFKRISSLNVDVMEKLTMSEPEVLWFPGSGNGTVHSWFLPPAQRSSASITECPLALLIHGGPQGNYGDDFHFRWNPQIFAAAGFAVLCINFHGSTSFGQAFTDSIRGDWGGAPFEDILLGVRAALETHAFLDPSRIAALGASYGGFMVNWLHGQAPDVFKAFVNHDGIFDTRTFPYTTEELWFPEWEFHGPQSDPGSCYDKWNPSAHVSKWCKPTLVIHGGHDFRCTEGEGIATFTALQRHGVPSRFVYFPDEGHWVTKPHNSLRWHEEVLGWLHKHV